MLGKTLSRAIASGAVSPLLALGAMGLLTMTQANPAQAITLQQTQTFTQADTFTNFPTASTSDTEYTSTLPQFTVQPFNSGLGTLTSTGIVWETIASFTGTSGTAAANGYASSSVSGTYYINDTSYSGNGGGNGNSGQSGNNFSVNLSPIKKNTQFPNPPSGYDPTILTYFLGGTPYTITYGLKKGSFSSPYNFSYTNIASGSASFTTKATVTYNYKAAPTPGPLPLLGVGAAWTWSRRLRRRCALRQG
jgi:hypothetical protein